MSRIVAFGCSITFGQGLDDCYVHPNQPGEVPSKFAWPNQLANKLNYECLNLSKSGYSNPAILDKIINTKFKDSDIICVLWTFKTRDIKYNISKNNVHLGRWVKDWYENVDMYDLGMKNLLAIHHAFCYLRMNEQKFYFMNVDEPSDFKFFSHSWLNDIKFIPINYAKYIDLEPKSKDQLHPGIKFHIEVANQFYSSIF